VSDAPTFTVTLHHLAPGAKQASAALPDTELPGLTDRKLRELIRALAALTSTNLGTASPELRVVAPHGQFVVKISEGRLRINSWTIKVGGADLSPDQIYSLITGAEAVAEAAGVDVHSGGTKPARGPMLAVLAALILGTNALTAWMLMRPPPPAPMLPEYAPLAQEPAERFLADLAGDYQTVTGDGARALKITKAGGVHWLQFGPGGAIAEDTELAAQPVQSHGQPALLADGRALIEPVNAVAVSFYQETYRRKVP
jgi:hypothetical protein